MHRRERVCQPRINLERPHQRQRQSRRVLDDFNMEGLGDDDRRAPAGALTPWPQIAITQQAFDAVVATSSLAALLPETRENMVD
jgi:hypothetical protein